MNKTILLTGFEPFGESKVNPSILACKRLERQKFNGYDVKVEEISLRFHEIQGILKSHIDAHAPAAIVSTGQGGGTCIALERVAINVADVTRLGYNCGAKPRDQTLIKDGPAAYFTHLPIRRLLERLRSEGIPTEISNSAGTFGCNQIFYYLMDCIEEKGLNIPAGFIHVPLLPEQAVDKREPSMSLEMTAKALEIVVSELTKIL